MSWREQLDVGELTVSKIIFKDPQELGETVGIDITSDDLSTGFQVSGDVDTGLLISGAVTTGISITGTATDAIKLTGVAANDGIDISGVTGGGKAIRAGSRSTPLDAAGATTEVITVGAETDEDDFLIGYGSYIATTGEDGKGFGFASLVEATNETGTPTVQGAQFMAFLGTVGGTEAAHLKTRGGDLTAGLFAAWFKIGANENCVMDSGSLAACIWLDNSMSGTKTGTRYSAFISAGTVSDAVFGFAGTGAWTNFIEADSDAYNRAPFNGGAVATQSGASDGSIVCDLNGTSVLIPFFNA